MTNWVVCTKNDGGDDIYVNLDQVTNVVAHPNGSLLKFVNETDRHLIVRQKPEQIFGDVGPRRA